MPKMICERCDLEQAWFPGHRGATPKALRRRRCRACAGPVRRVSDAAHFRRRYNLDDAGAARLARMMLAFVDFGYPHLSGGYRRPTLVRILADLERGR